MSERREFGDGIVSAIDFETVTERQADPNGVHIKTGMTATAGLYCLKQFSRCHCKKCGCGLSETRDGANARPDW